MYGRRMSSLWFDVGIKRYTTGASTQPSEWQLWFDVGIKRYTTHRRECSISSVLWFDVGIKRYTTKNAQLIQIISCGLM